jgi:hypothetical protein
MEKPLSCSYRDSGSGERPGSEGCGTLLCSKMPSPCEPEGPQGLGAWSIPLAWACVKRRAGRWTRFLRLPGDPLQLADCAQPRNWRRLLSVSRRDTAMPHGCEAFWRSRLWRIPFDKWLLMGSSGRKRDRDADGGR